MIWHPRTEAEARRMAWDDDDWDGGIAHCVSMIGEPDGPVVDFGCGPGRLTVPVAAGHPAVGYDPNPAMLPRRKRKGATFTSELPEPESAALVFSVLVVQHLPFSEQRAFIGSMVDVCRPGGRVALQFVPYGDRGPLSHPVVPEVVVGWFRSAGLECVGVTFDPEWPTWAWAEGVKP